MDQLVQSMRQRQSDIQLLQNPKIPNISELLIKEKQRSQKQNWVFKILKSLKILTPQLKQDIYFKSQKMMMLYQNVSMEKKQDLSENFTQKIINLYISFFNIISDKLTQNNSIKALMRPNNGFIVTDLIKSLIQLQRKKFRDAYVSGFIPQNQVKTHRKKILTEFHGDLDRSFVAIKQIEIQYKKIQQKKKNMINNPQQLIRKVLKQKFKSFIRTMDVKELQHKVNANFLQLKQNNQRNGVIINKHRQKCLGKTGSQCTNYDLAGLYTKEELRQIEERLNNKNYSPHDKQAYYNDSANEEFCTLKQSALKEFQKLQNLFTYQKKTFKKSSIIQKWLPLSIIKKLSKENPLEIYIINHKHKIKSSQILEDPEISSVGIRNFLVTKLNQKFTVNEDLLTVSQQGESKVFDKKTFLDFGRKKQLSFVCGDKGNCKKQLLFPLIKEHKQKQLMTNDHQTLDHRQRHVQRHESEFRVRKSQSQPKFLQKLVKPTTNNTKLPKNHQTHINTSLNTVTHLSPEQQDTESISKSVELHPISIIKKSPITLKIRKNSVQQVLSQRILQRKLEIEEENQRYQKRIKLLFGTESQKAGMKTKAKRIDNKSSLMGFSSAIGYEHFLLH